tara:strand:+ start:1190 stop:1342 length:153 start_codon:yes stop_codon:yes gene_type:complete
MVFLVVFGGRLKIVQLFTVNLGIEIVVSVHDVVKPCLTREFQNVLAEETS